MIDCFHLEVDHCYAGLNTKDVKPFMVISKRGNTYDVIYLGDTSPRYSVRISPFAQFRELTPQEELDLKMELL